MIIATTRGVAGATGPNPHGAIGDGARVIGRFAFRTSDDQFGPSSTRVELRTNGTFGSLTGYATLDDAIEATSYLTAGKPAPAAIFEHDGRYYAYRTLADELGTGGRRLSNGLNLEPADTSYVYDFARLARVRRLKAIVDGSFVHRFRFPLARI